MGKNDFFKPLLFEDVVSISLSTYNQFGQMIFTSDEHFKGWDGTVKGAAQNSCGFVWVCSYRFEGETEQGKNGSIIFQTLGVIVILLNSLSI